MLVDQTWCSNGLRFETPTEAETYARNLFMRWTQPDGWRVVDDEGKVHACPHEWREMPPEDGGPSAYLCEWCGQWEPPRGQEASVGELMKAIGHRPGWEPQ